MLISAFESGRVFFKLPKINLKDSNSGTKVDPLVHAEHSMPTVTKRESSEPKHHDRSDSVTESVAGPREEADEQVSKADNEAVHAIMVRRYLLGAISPLLTKSRKVLSGKMSTKLGSGGRDEIFPQRRLGGAFSSCKLNGRAPTDALLH